MSSHFDGPAPLRRSGHEPFSSLTGREPIRLVNQFESGTSSTVLMFCARLPVGLSWRSRTGCRHFIEVDDLVACALTRPRFGLAAIGSSS